MNTLVFPDRQKFIPDLTAFQRAVRARVRRCRTLPGETRTQLGRIGHLVRILRRKQPWTLADLAHKAGIPWLWLALLEQNLLMPEEITDEYLHKLGEAFPTRQAVSDPAGLFLTIVKSLQRMDRPSMVSQSAQPLTMERVCWEKALASNEARYGPRHPQVAAAAKGLSNILHALGKLPDARACMERALAINEAIYGAHHPAVAADLSCLGGILLDLKDFTTARHVFERALAIDQAAFGPENETVAVDLNNLGGLLYHLGDFTAARPMFEQALAIDKAVYGPHNLQVGLDLNNLATTWYALGHTRTAQEFFRQAWTILRGALDPASPLLLTIQNVLHGQAHSTGH
jgi:tetratricopeptide (TPR) repeat protein